MQRALDRATIPAAVILALAACVGGNDWQPPDGGTGGQIETSTLECADGHDNDGDGFVDCEDPSCYPVCTGSDGDADVDADIDGDADTDTDGDSDFEECVASSVEADTRVRQPNIVFAVDSSSSMRAEADRVQENMNRFAADIMAAEVDPRVVMIAERSYVVVPPPLGADATHFLHIDNWVGSHNALGRLLGEVPSFSSFLHADGVTHFVVVTDDESETDPSTWRAQMEEALGSDFVFHAIASPRPTCPGAADPGDRYYQLAVETGGIQASICTDDWTAVFDEIRNVVTESTFLPCTFAIPEPPDDEVLNFFEVNVVYTPGGGEAQTLPYTATEGGCAGVHGWYYDDPDSPTEIHLCPVTCEAVGSDGEAQIDLALGCATIPI